MKLLLEELPIKNEGNVQELEYLYMQIEWIEDFH